MQFFCEEKQKVSLLVYHLEGLRVPLAVRVPQFGNHFSRGKEITKQWYYYEAMALLVLFDKRWGKKPGT